MCIRDRFEIDELVVSDFEYQFSEKTENSWNIIYQTEKIKDFRLIMEISPKSKDSIFRFRYRLQSEQCVHMTKSHGNSQPCYFSCKQMDLQGVWNEIQFAQFLPNIHSFIPQKKKSAILKNVLEKYIQVLFWNVKQSKAAYLWHMNMVQNIQTIICIFV